METEKYEIGDIVQCTQGEAYIALISSEAGDINGGGQRYYAHTFTSKGDYLGEFKVYTNELNEVLAKMVDAQLKWVRSLFADGSRPYETKIVFKDHMILFFPKLFKENQGE